MIDELAATWRLADARLYAADTQQDRYPETRHTLARWLGRHTLAGLVG